MSRSSERYGGRPRRPSTIGSGARIGAGIGAGVGVGVVVASIIIFLLLSVLAVGGFLLLAAAVHP